MTGGPGTTVLAAVDFSPASEKALRSAVTYARALGATLHVLHVMRPGGGAGREEAIRGLAALVRGSGLAAITALEEGLPAAEIVRYASRHAATLIVVGTHGRTGFTRLLLGSVAERVARTAPCPVLSVPPLAMEEARMDFPAPPPAAVRLCVVCAHASEDLTCEPCRARIRGEALRHKMEELGGGA